VPRIRELAGLKNGRLGFCVDSQGEAHGAPQADVLAYVAGRAQLPDAAFERFVEGKYSIPDCQVRVHCFSKEPLRFAFNVADKGVEIPENWWVHPEGSP